MNKLCQITVSFWIMKICATTLGETVGDLLSMTLNLGYALSSLILFGFFLITFYIQISSNEYSPVKYWSVILATSIVGTTVSDFMDRTLGLGYALGSIILFALLTTVLLIWFQKEKSLSVTKIQTRSEELFYWTAILISNTLGTALGDFLADDSGLGFSGGAFLIGFLLFIFVLAYFFTTISRVILFWSSFVLTRPFGATFGDFLMKPTEKGGLNFGTVGSSLFLFVIFAILVVISIVKNKGSKESNTENSLS
jgi:uncharacterized membrane-anchored protein